MLLPARAYSFNAVPFLAHKGWNFKLFSTATGAQRSVGFDCLENGCQIVFFLPELIAFELMSARKPSDAAIGTVFEDEIPASTLAGDSIFIPSFTSFAAIHPFSVLIR